jgi:hypothetical protein
MVITTSRNFRGERVSIRDVASDLILIIVVVSALLGVARTVNIGWWENNQNIGLDLPIWFDPRMTVCRGTRDQVPLHRPGRLICSEDTHWSLGASWRLEGLADYDCKKCLRKTSLTAWCLWHLSRQEATWFTSALVDMWEPVPYGLKKSKDIGSFIS